ncbi:hypothetical protein [Methylobacterium frigidaeris]|uniref:Uncharacterized protein n=1 Tax=Methylobacterium frigidaeris TaxID=2038277 RepID=A0AA37HI41_9HYPH|nr:hypothetical protein [Methylobacterium frigidaeris]GJD66004.1 hypothetical protein MPEAHAMD_6200 [Methylobacterium frigidaeris]
MIGLADLVRDVPAGHEGRRRIACMSAAVAAFALGCGLAAPLYDLVGLAAVASSRSVAPHSMPLRPDFSLFSAE